MWKNIAEEGRSQMTIWHMRIACRILKATNTLSEYVTLIACPLKKWLIEPASMLRYTCIACLVYYYEFPEYVSCTLYVEGAASVTKYMRGF
jgi:hypothetical protein